MESAVSVLIVDDQEPFRRAARTVVTATPGFQVVGEATSGEEGVELAVSRSPALVLMDIKMAGVDGLEATRRILDVRPHTVVVLLSTYDAEDLPTDASASGAAAYLNKEEFGPEVLEDVWRRRGPR
jgi:two-component system, NarL family, invasion response regulator UvrY